MEGGGYFFYYLLMGKAVVAVWRELRLCGGEDGSVTVAFNAAAFKDEVLAVLK